MHGKCVVQIECVVHGCDVLNKRRPYVLSEHTLVEKGCSHFKISGAYIHYIYIYIANLK